MLLIASFASKLIVNTKRRIGRQKMPKMRHLPGAGICRCRQSLSSSGFIAQRFTTKWTTKHCEDLRIKSERQPLEVLDRLQGFLLGQASLWPSSRVVSH